MIPSALNWYNTGVTVTLGELIESGVDIWKGCDHQMPNCTLSSTNMAVLRRKIENHYYFRQIGQETPARFLHYLHARMCEIMPYYCQLYEFEETFHSVEDKLESYHLTETLDKKTTGTGTVSGSSEGTSTGTDTTNANNTKKFSNTPQGSIANLDSYMTEATVDNGTATDTSTSTASGSSEQASEESGTETYTLVRRGNIGVQPLGQEVKDIRSAFINIDMMIIKELEDLFLKVY